MNCRSLFLLLATLGPITALAQSTNDRANDKTAPRETPVVREKIKPALNQETRALQQFEAKRDAMEAARASAVDKMKSAKSTKDKKTATDEVRKIESDFLKENADLISQLTASADQKKILRPSKGR